MLFTDLNLKKPLLNALADLNYSTPTSIQQHVFSVVMSGADVCGIAQTGTGKTLAYLLPLLNLWEYAKEKNPQILVVVPTRELVTQVVETAAKLATYQSLIVRGVYGGTNIHTQRTDLQGGCDLLVATPGRLYDLAVTGAFKVKSIKRLVIDEVDEMLNLGFRTQLKNILDLLPPKRQSLLFSATLVPDVEVLLNEYFADPVRIEAAPAGTPVETIIQTAYQVPNFYTKVNLLNVLLADSDGMDKVLVFVVSKKKADLLHETLEGSFPGAIGVIHSNKEQNHRFNAVRQFKEGTYRVLIATDIVARGIDIAEVTHVINFDVPETPENYIHRIGRTGRADNRGMAISFISEKEQPDWQLIEQYMKVAIAPSPLPSNVEVSAELIEEEQPKPYTKEIELKASKQEGKGAAFHPKSAKNSKVNKRVSRKAEMKRKYGKPIKKGKK